MGERCLEFTCTNGKLLTESIVKPYLLQQCTTTASSIDAQVKSQLIKRLTCETKHSIRDREARVSHVILIVGLIQALVIIIVKLTSRLHKQIRLKHKISLLGCDRETFPTCQRYHTVVGIFFILCHSGQWHEQYSYS